MSKPFRNFRMERLEERQMMAGDMNAYIENDILHVTEAAGQLGRNNSVFIRQMSENTIRVLGTTNTDGAISLINGKQYQDFTIQPKTDSMRPITLDVNLGGGNDNVNVVDFTGNGHTFFLRYVAIKVADPNNNNIADQDSVYLSNVHVHGVSNTDVAGPISVSTGVGNDVITLDHVTSSDPRYYGSALGIGAGAGADHVEVWNSYFSGNVDIATDGSLDSYVDDLKMINVSIGLASKLDVKLGGGNDTFLFDGVSLSTPRTNGFTGSFVLDAGAGNDTGSIKNTTAYSLKALLGDGSDTLKLDYIKAYNMDLQGQGGTGDSLYKTNNITVDEVFTQGGWELINGRSALLANLLNTTNMTTTTR